MKSSGIKVALLAIARKLIMRTSLPGRYLLAQLIAKTFMPLSGFVEGQVGDYCIDLDLRDGIQVQIFFGLYDQAETRLLMRLLKPGSVFFDVGANVGYYSLVASQIVGDEGQVHAFEPIARNVLALKQTIEINSVSNVVINPVAVGASKGCLTLYVSDHDPGNSGWASVVMSEDRPKLITVEMTSLEQYVQSNAVERVALIKLDIEGAELDALSGGKRLLSRPDAPDLICEVNPFLLERQNLHSQDLTKSLADYGYWLYRADIPLARPLDPDKALSRVTNLFCTKKPERITMLSHISQGLCESS